eukprot:1381396-Amorphochlora_amoeboformis.AAC.2
MGLYNLVLILSNALSLVPDMTNGVCPQTRIHNATAGDYAAPGRPERQHRDCKREHRSRQS